MEDISSVSKVAFGERKKHVPSAIGDWNVKVRFLDENKYYLIKSMLTSLHWCILNLFFLHRATNIYTSEAATS